MSRLSGFLKDVWWEFNFYWVIQILINLNKKSYKIAIEELSKAYKTFKKGYLKILQLNELFEKGNETYEVEVNGNTVHDFKDRKKTYLEELPKIDSSSRVKSESYKTNHMNIRKLTSSDTESIVDEWYLNEYLFEPANQGIECGSCYAFAALAAIEGAMAVRGYKRVKLSEMEAIKCTNGCDCGYTEWIYDYLVEKGGAAAASDYPYDPSKLRDLKCDTSNRKRVENSKIIGYSNCNGQVSIEKCMKYILFKKGPLTAYIHYNEDFDRYHGGTYSHTSNMNGELVYHAITIVGYGKDSGYEYWLARNSYGTDWGDKGELIINKLA